MNHSIPYSAFPVISHEERRQSDYQLYETIVAAISDINITLPTCRELTLGITSSEDVSTVYIYQSNTAIHSYELVFLPSPFRRFLILFRLGFVEIEYVEKMKADIESRYQYGERIIL